MVNGDKHTLKKTKNKCENYRGITLLLTAYKLFANIIKNRLNEHLEDEMVEEQCCFRKGSSCIDAMFTVQQIMEKRKEHNLPLFLLFIDYEKAYDNVNRDKLWEMMGNKIPNYLLNTIKCIYRSTKVRINFMMVYLNQCTESPTSTV
jgi:sorting nexin-29